MTDAYRTERRSSADPGAAPAPRSGYDGTAYERIGGADALDTVVEQFFVRVLAEPGLRRFFVHESDGVAVPRTDLERLKGHFSRLVATLLGAPVAYSGRNVAEAHRGLRITGGDYDQASDLFLGTLCDNDVPDDVIAVVAEKLDALKPLIVEVFRPAYAGA